MKNKPRQNTWAYPGTFKSLNKTNEIEKPIQLNEPHLESKKLKNILFMIGNQTLKIGKRINLLLNLL